MIFTHTVPGVKRGAVLSAYILSVFTLLAVCRKLPGWIAYWKRIRYENPYVLLFMSDTALRVRLSLGFSVATNTAYALFQLCMGMYHASVWFYAFAVYYGLLVLMRLFLLREVNAGTPGQNLLREWERYRFCGIILLVMNLSLGTIVAFIVLQNRGFSHHPVTTVVMAIYTFCALIYSIRGLFKFKKYRSPVYTATKTVRLAAALVSVLTLETALLSAFGGSDEHARRLITAATGSVVTGIILIIAVTMIIRSTREIRKIRKQL
ncbi:MAG: hypothetical protein ACI3XM_01590 [Eubacteriales bacterium]